MQGEAATLMKTMKSARAWAIVDVQETEGPRTTIVCNYHPFLCCALGRLVFVVGGDGRVLW